MPAQCTNQQSISLKQDAIRRAVDRKAGHRPDMITADVRSQIFLLTSCDSEVFSRLTHLQELGSFINRMCKFPPHKISGKKRKQKKETNLQREWSLVHSHLHIPAGQGEVGQNSASSLPSADLYF